ncbi:MAG: mechanosensitive ion channel [Gammaproteobacteria bacterium]|nr:mechanosensitive ion channel [Gammaproteobacteria bacterium]
MENFEFLQHAQTLAIGFAIDLAIAVVILMVGRWLSRLGRKLATKGMERIGADALVVRFVGSIVSILILVVALLAAINQLGVQTTSLLAILGAAGLAVGLALQGSLSNFAAGVLLLSLRPYRMGDYIEGAGVAGTVDELQLFTTVLNTPDNRRIIIPNSQMMNGTIVNYSAYSTRRVDLVVSVSYDAPADQVSRVLNQVIESDQRILSDPEPFLRMSGHADSAVEWTIRAWVKTEDFWPVHWDLVEGTKRALDEAGIAIPYPQRDVHVYQHKAD